MSRIKCVEAKDGYCLWVLMENGSSIVLNLESRIETVRFRKLADRAFFQTVTTDGEFIRWGDEIEISVNEAFQLAQK